MKTNLLLGKTVLSGKKIILFFLAYLCLSGGIYSQTIDLNPTPNIKAPTVTTLTTSANPSVNGAPVTLTATVSSNSNSITPTGTVIFKDAISGSILTPNGVILTNGVANFLLLDLGLLGRSILAEYSGDENFVPSTSQILQQTIFIQIDGELIEATSVTLTSSANPSVAGSPVTFTATIRSTRNPALPLTGTVTFRDVTNNTILTPNGVSLVNDIATFTTSALPFGTRQISATYNGDSNGNQTGVGTINQVVDLVVSGLALNLTVNLDQSTISETNTTRFGDRITLIATVESGVGAAGGTITFSNNGFFLGTAALDGSGIARLTTNSLPVGVNNIQAQFFSTTSNLLPLTVIPAVPPIEFGSPGASPVPVRIYSISDVGRNVISNGQFRYNFGDNSPYGRTVRLSAHVMGLGGIQATLFPVTGEISFYIDGPDGQLVLLGTTGLDPLGNGSITTSIIPVGRQEFFVRYFGNDIYSIGDDANAINIVKGGTQTTINSNLNPSVAGQEITYTATISSIFPESTAPRPTGEVAFFINGNEQPAVPIDPNGTATFRINTLTPGNYNVQARYLGNDNYLSSNSPTIGQSVEQVGTALFFPLGDTKSALINTSFGSSLAVSILNFNPRLTNGLPITYTAPSSGPSGTFSNGTNTITVQTTSSSGSSAIVNGGEFIANGIAGDYEVIASIPGFGNATFRMTNEASPVPITIGTSVNGLSYSYSDNFGTLTFNDTRSFNIIPGRQFTLATTSPQIGPDGLRYIFNGWSDGFTDLTRTITSPDTPTTFTAEFLCEREWVLDADGDNYYVGSPIISCQSPGLGYVPIESAILGDCNDANPDVNPGTSEVCDGIDNNCNSEIDEGVKSTFFFDSDGDGFGDPLVSIQSCAAPENYVSNNLDCDDNNSAINPTTEWFLDADGDGFYTGESIVQCESPGEEYKFTGLLGGGDCDDNDETFNPNAPIITNGDQTLPAEAGLCTANFIASADASKTCATGEVVGTRSDRKLLTDPYPVGITTITWTVVGGNDFSVTPVVQAIIVTDAQIPVIITNGDQSLEADLGLCSTTFLATASASDNCSVGTPTGLRSDNKSLADPYPVGKTTIQWTVTDIHGNDAIPVNQIIEVLDKENPTIVVKDFSLQLDNTGNGILMVNDIDNGSFDNCQITTRVLSKTNFTCEDQGENSVTLKITDGAGNSSEAEAIVTVLAPLNPLTVSINSTVVPNANNNVVVFEGASMSLGLPSTVTLSATNIPTTYTGLTYKWYWKNLSSGSYQSEPISNSSSLIINAAGDFSRIYRLVVTSESGCVTEKEIHVISVNTACGKADQNRVSVCQILPNGRRITLCLNPNAAKAFLARNPESFIGSCANVYRLANEPEIIKVAWNTPFEMVRQKIKTQGDHWFNRKKIDLAVSADSYDPMVPGSYEFKVEMEENEWYILEEPISIKVLVLEKPQALDISISNRLLAKDLRFGQVIGTLYTLDSVDNIHSYSLEEHPDFEIQGDKMVWKGNSIPPAQINLKVSSTDRAGQTINKQIQLSREIVPNEFILYPNPTQNKANIVVDLDEGATIEVRVFDTVGRMVIQDSIYRDKTFLHTLDLDGLTPGVYMVQVKIGYIVMTERLIKL